MARAETTERDVLDFLHQFPQATVTDLRERFPEADVWMLRQQRREFQQDSLYDAVSELSTAEAEIRTIKPQGQLALRAGFFRPTTVTRLPLPVDRVKPLFKKAGQEYLILPDIHAPDHDPHALDVAIQIGQSLALDELIVSGDGMDVHALSRYTPSAHRPIRWVDERAKAVPVFAMIRDFFPKTPITYLIGNHDVRPEKFVAAQAPQLQGLFTLPQILGLDSLDFRFPETNRVVIGEKLLVVHGTRVRAEAGSSVQAEVREAGMSVAMGHVHRRAMYDVTRTAQRLYGDQPLFGIEMGCLCSLTPEYLEPERTANWQHGCLVVTVFDNGFVFPELVRIDNGCAMFRGRMFMSRVKEAGA
jgi:UDP-2,3-diacylglucosamine pyrophosphatase LpxH